MLVLADSDNAFGCFHLYRRNLLSKEARFLRAFRAALRTQRKEVLRLAVDAELLGNVLRGLAH